MVAALGNADILHVGTKTVRRGQPKAAELVNIATLNAGGVANRPRNIIAPTMDTLLDSTLPKIRQRIFATMSDHHVPGVAVRILRAQKLVFGGGFRLVDIDTMH